MRPIATEEALPVELTAYQAVEAAYSRELVQCAEALARGLSVLVECEKELVPYYYRSLRDRLKASGRTLAYLDGRREAEGAGGVPLGLVATMIAQIRDAVRGWAEGRILALPHLDLVTASSSAGLTAEAREVIPLLYENPEILWIGFKDPSFSVPRVIENLFPHHESLLGVARDRLAHLVTRRESRKFGRGLDVYRLYKYVSGLNAVRLRRLLSGLAGEDYPLDPTPVLAQLRSATAGGDFVVPEIDLDRDVGGYARVKERLTREILDILHRKDELEDEEAIRRVEGLIPRGMIFWGPPGTGKTLFAKAMAAALGAAITVVSGPELKSKWVGESEERIRQLFVRARRSAPSILVFDELDSFASARGTYAGSGVEHSMVNQLLTEMDGFRKDELVFVVGTTNFVEILDPALLRPGRFEFQLAIPWPGPEDRRAILEIYDRKLGLALSERALEYAVERTGDRVEGSETPYSGDHVQALCRAIARKRLRGEIAGSTTPADVEAALQEYRDRPRLTAEEERVVATHEAGHAVCALHCPHAPPIDRISIQGDLGGALGFVQYADPARRYVVTRGQILDSICVLFGGREAEAALLDDLSIGSAHDLERATALARSLVEEFGMGGDGVAVRRYSGEGTGPPLSDGTRAALEEGVRRILEDERERAGRILEENRGPLVALRDLLLEKKVLDREAFSGIEARR